MAKIKTVYIITKDGEPYLFERYPDVIMVACFTSIKKAQAAKKIYALNNPHFDILSVELYPKQYHPIEIRDSMEVRAEMRAQDDAVKREGHWQG